MLLLPPTCGRIIFGPVSKTCQHSHDSSRRCKRRYVSRLFVLRCWREQAGRLSARFSCEWYVADIKYSPCTQPPECTTVTCLTTYCKTRITRPGTHGNVPGHDTSLSLALRQDSLVGESKDGGKRRDYLAKRNAPGGSVGVEAPRRTEARKDRAKQRREKQRLYSRFQSLSKEWQTVLIPAHEDEALVRSLVWLLAPNCFENASHE